MIINTYSIKLRGFGHVVMSHNEEMKKKISQKNDQKPR
jgi:hypothetical protein